MYQMTVLKDVVMRFSSSDVEILNDLAGTISTVNAERDDDGHLSIMSDLGPVSHSVVIVYGGPFRQ